MYDKKTQKTKNTQKNPNKKKKPKQQKSKQTTQKLAQFLISVCFQF